METAVLDGVRPKGKRGRPSDPNKILFSGGGIPELGARASQREWLGLWPGDTQNDQLQAVFDMIMKIRPDGPEGFPHKGIAPRYRAPSSLTRYMEKHGLTRTEALARIATEYRKEHPEDFE